MLTENDIIDALCDYLEAHGYKIHGRADTSQTGIDIIAEKPEGSGPAVASGWTQVLQQVGPSLVPLLALEIAPSFQ